MNWKRPLESRTLIGIADSLNNRDRGSPSAVSALATRSVGELSATELDESFRQHLSASYWQWLECFQSDPEATIQQHPDFLFSDLRAQQALQQRPGFFLRRSFDEGTVWAAGVVPKTVTLPRAAGLGWKRQVSGYRLVGSRFFGAGSVERQQTLLSELEDFLQRRSVDFLLLEDVLQPSPTWTLLTARPRPTFRLEFLTALEARSRIRLPKDPELYWGGFSKNARKQNRRLLEDSRRFTLWKATDVSHVAELWVAAKQVAEHSWQADRLRIRLCEDEARFNMLTFLAQQGALRSYVLFDGTTPIAFELDHQFNGYLVSEDAAYDQRYAEYGPGRTLLLRVLEDLFEHQSPRWYDFAGGDWDYKRRFANDLCLSAKVWLVRKDIRFHVISLLLRAERALRSRGRRLGELLRPKGWGSKPPRPAN